ncbi:hypothetical protein [Kitasatospora azatica]|uniref:hypothetical protein n=1 Tax=Kitasatospora azatica TaxID=58347 RepID=UPI0012F7F4C7|nr:hypothetical protein [Kitasatospora azatica]
MLSDQRSLSRLVTALGSLGFAPAGMSPQGNLLHRYQRGAEAGLLVVDVLAPDKLALAAALHNPQHPGWRELRDAAARADGQSAYAFLSPP